MTVTQRLISPLLLGALALLPACKGDAPTPPAGAQKSAKGAQKGTPAVPNLGKPGDGFDLPKMRSSLDGTWIINPQWGQRIDVWHLDGSKAKLLRGALEREVDALVDLHAPCRIRFTTKGVKGGPDFSWTRNFVLEEGKLFAGQAATGLIQGDRTIVCGRQGTFIKQGDQCAYHPMLKPGAKKNAKVPAPVAAKCSLEGQSFEAQAGKVKAKLTRRGEILVADAVRPLEKMPSFEAAKTRFRQASMRRPGEALEPIKGRVEDMKPPTPAPSSQPQ
ncbi:MAG: hypothetical protein ACE366_11165 [Bradymonadia bacterium]